MKIRIKDNSLRLRLTQSEVDAIENQGQCEAAIEFPGGKKLQYALRVGGGSIRADFMDDCITVWAPEDSVQKWLQPTEVGMEQWIDLDTGSQLRILIEKDFACLTERTDEDESDNFPNPLAHC